MDSMGIKKRQYKHYLLVKDCAVSRTTMWRWKKRVNQVSAVLASTTATLATTSDTEESISSAEMDSNTNDTSTYGNTASASSSESEEIINDSTENNDEVVSVHNIDDNKVMAEQKDENEVDKNGFNAVMFRDAGFTEKDVITMIYALSLRHGFSIEARQDIIELLKLCSNLRHDNKRSYSDYLISQMFDPLDEALKYIFYCKSCKGTLLETTKSKFTDCKIQCRNSQCKEEHNLTLTSENLFIILNVSEQVGTILSNKKTFNDLIIPKTNSDNALKISDIHDGQIYQQLCKSNLEFHLTYNFNTDGAPIFHSSKITMWPIQMIINELPPKQRFRNLIFAGIWLGKQEPNNHMMNTIIMNFGNEAKRLLTDGVTFRNPNDGDIMNWKMAPLFCCLDSVARPLLQNRLQFNGYYGCSWCYHPGYPVNKQIKYPTLEEMIEKRSHKSFLLDLQQVTECNYEKIIKGVKGPTALLTLPKFDVVWGLPPDYMHGVLLGVFRQMWDLWTTYTLENRHSYYLGNPNTLKKINTRLMSIKPPQEIHRLPRPLSEKAKWKASEWRSFFLYYAVPCLEGILKDKYFQHFVLLVRSIFCLLKTNITQENLNEAENHIKVFVSKFERLYGMSSMTYNVHCLLHLTDSVKKSGPLWCTSTFPFESGIFKIKQQVKGPVGITKQICKKIYNVNTFVNKTNNDVSLHNDTKMYCNNLFSNQKIKHAHENDNCTFIGPASLIEDEDLLNKICEVENQSGDICSISLFKYKKCIYRNQVFHSVEYTKSKKTNDTIIKTESGFVKILNFLSCQLGNYMYVEKLTSEPYTIGNFAFEHIFIVNPERGEKEMLQLSQMQEKCVYIEINQQKTYVCLFPNTVEIQ